MRKIIAIFSVILVVTLGVFIQGHSYKEHPAQTMLINQLVILKQSVKEFEQLLQEPGLTKVKTEAIKKSYFSIRAEYKKIEFLLEFLDPLFVKDYFNAAPLPKLDKVAPSLTIMQPHGLQVIDEIIADDLSNETINQLKIEASWLNKQLKDYHIVGKVNHRIVFEGIYTGLIRLYTLGLTGFDTPGTLNGINDAATVLKSMQQTLSTYKFNAALFAYAAAYLHKNNDFDKFDRLHFLVNYLNPLIHLVQTEKTKLGIENMEEVNPGLHALNYTANNLFSDNLLYPDFYIRIPQKYRTNEVKALGKTLFFDPILSANNKMACASCHNPNIAFSDGLAKSNSSEAGKFLKRNSPGLINAVYSERFFWDLRAESLEDQTEHVIFNKDEFNTDYFKIFTILSQSKQYQQLFKNAFNDFEGNTINRTTLSFALSAYVSSLASANSAFDKYVRGEQKQISTEIKNGYNLFMGKAACGTCHFAPTFSGNVPPFFTESESEVLGVPQNPYAKDLALDEDMGRAEGRLKENVYFYQHSFKTPTIRNVALTAPYMHNGAYKNLEDVMDFYNQGGGAGLGLTVNHQTLASDKLNLTKKEINEIIAFMKSLTDTASLTSVPQGLPIFENQPELNARKVGGIY